MPALTRSAYALPVRLAFSTGNPAEVVLLPSVLIGGRPTVARVTKRAGGTDAGWTVLSFLSAEDRAAFMLRCPDARMPSWARVPS